MYNKFTESFVELLQTKPSKKQIYICGAKTQEAPRKQNNNAQCKNL